MLTLFFWFVLPCFVSLLVCFIFSLRALLSQSCFVFLTCANNCRVQGGVGWDRGVCQKLVRVHKDNNWYLVTVRLPTKVTKLGSILNHFIH